MSSSVGRFFARPAVCQCFAGYFTQLH
jgi:hypothetical protein